MNISAMSASVTTGITSQMLAKVCPSREGVSMAQALDDAALVTAAVGRCMRQFDATGEQVTFEQLAAAYAQAVQDAAPRRGLLARMLGR